MAPDIRFPSIDSLRAFEAGARLGSFERAGDELFIGASAVGKLVALQLKKLPRASAPASLGSRLPPEDPWRQA